MLKWLIVLHRNKSVPFLQIQLLCTQQVSRDQYLGTTETSTLPGETERLELFW